MFELASGFVGCVSEQRILDRLREMPGVECAADGMPTSGATTMTSSAATRSTSGLALSSSGRTVRRSYSVDMSRDVETCSDESTGSPDEDQLSARAEGNVFDVSSSHLTRSSTEGSDPDKKIRRQIANCNERRRMQSINAGFQQLKNLVRPRDSEKLSKAAILQHAVDYIHQLLQQRSCLTQMLEGLGARRPSQLQLTSSDTASPFNPAAAGALASLDLDELEKMGVDPAPVFPPNLTTSGDAAAQRHLVPPPPAKRRRTEDSSSSTSSAASEDGRTEPTTLTFVRQQTSTETSSLDHVISHVAGGSRSGVVPTMPDDIVMLAESVKPQQVGNAGLDSSRLQPACEQPTWMPSGNDVVKKEFIETEIVCSPPYLSADAVVPTVDDVGATAVDAVPKIDGSLGGRAGEQTPACASSGGSAYSSCGSWQCPTTSQRNLETIIEAIRFLEGDDHSSVSVARGNWIAEQRYSSIVDATCLAELDDSMVTSANRKWSSPPSRHSTHIMQAVRSS